MIGPIYAVESLTRRRVRDSGHIFAPNPTLDRLGCFWVPVLASRPKTTCGLDRGAGGARRGRVVQPELQTERYEAGVAVLPRRSGNGLNKRLRAIPARR